MKKPLSLLSTDRVLVAPSILAADFSALGQEIGRVGEAGADIIHVDVMDGHFVPNLTLGPPVVASIRHCTDLPFDVHLMLTDPAVFIQPFAEAGADNVTIHVEIDGDIPAILQHIHAEGCSAGLSLRPGTSAAALAPYLGQIDLILVMTVEPGFGGQAFQPAMLAKLQTLQAMISAVDRPIHLEVDGGIDAETAPRVTAAGANLLVAGTSIFRADVPIADAIARLKPGGQVTP